ncbi:MAG: response regulator transcription factor [Candidatus Sericytochromatia bacterium]|nr:response regulator transcription factor [Candidatus Tanganyikabacteria bacterium]
MSDKAIRVVLIDDHRLVREGLKALLAMQGGVDVVGEAPGGETGIALVQEVQPDVVLMDVSMPGMSGIEATEAIRRVAPEVRVLALTMHESPEYFARMLDAGAAGYVLKGASSEELVTAIRSVWLGGLYVSAGVAAFLARLPPAAQAAGAPQVPRADAALTAREEEILDLLAEGLRNLEVAERLQVSVSTVGSHMANLVRKLGLENSRQLVLHAMRRRFSGDPP